MIKEIKNRPLVAFEKAFWLLDYTNSPSFTMVIALDEVLLTPKWESALAKAQKQNLNLTRVIQSDLSNDSSLNILLKI